jgi:hypothetical protein
VPNRTRNDRNQLVVDMQMHLVDHSMNQLHNYIDLLVLEKLGLDYNSNQDMNTGLLNWNLHLVYSLNYLIAIVLDYKNYLEDEEQLAKLHLKQMLMMDHRNRMIEDRLKRKKIKKSFFFFFVLP